MNISHNDSALQLNASTIETATIVLPKTKQLEDSLFDFSIKTEIKKIKKFIGRENLGIIQEDCITARKKFRRLEYPSKVVLLLLIAFIAVLTSLGVFSA